MSMKLAVILSSLDSGGLERTCLHLIQEWARQGIQVDLVVGRADGRLRDEIPYDAQVFEIASRASVFFPLGLRRYLQQRRPTHIISAGYDISVIALCIANTVSNNVSVTVALHGVLTNQLETSKGFQRVKYRALIWLLKHNLKSAHALVAVSKGLAEDLQKHLTLNEKPITVIYNPVITDQTWKKIAAPLNACPVPDGVEWIVYVGRFVPEKGLDVLLGAFKAISTETNVHLVLVGDGPLESSLKSQAVELGVKDRIHFIGFQRNPFPWMREANVLVLPSRSEGLGNVLIEAMACGTQVIACDCPGGPAEILDSGRYGQLVPTEDEDALALAILSSLRNQFHVPENVLKERAAMFSSERAANQYFALLRG